MSHCLSAVSGGRDLSSLLLHYQRGTLMVVIVIFTGAKFLTHCIQTITFACTNVAYFRTHSQGLSCFQFVLVHRRSEARSPPFDHSATLCTTNYYSLRTQEYNSRAIMRRASSFRSKEFLSLTKIGFSPISSRISPEVWG